MSHYKLLKNNYVCVYYITCIINYKFILQQRALQLILIDNNIQNDSLNILSSKDSFFLFNN